MKIAFIGATSQIASDLIVNMDKNTPYECVLYSRNPEKQAKWVSNNLINKYETRNIETFSKYHDEKYDLLINFVGVGDPAKAKQIGRFIFEITKKYDEECLGYLEKNKDAKYVFLSSGAIYGNSFYNPDDNLQEGKFSVNALGPEDWYGLAKLYSEATHRALNELNIYDLRVFGYFSRTQNISGRFLLSDIIRAIVNKETLCCSSDNIVRDYVHPDDFFRLIKIIIENNIPNQSIDCYSSAPIEKNIMLAKLKEVYGLQYEINQDNGHGSNIKSRYYYYPRDKKAVNIGYVPQYSSLESVLMGMDFFIKNGSCSKCN